MYLLVSRGSVSFPLKIIQPKRGHQSRVASRASNHERSEWLALDGGRSAGYRARAPL